MDWIVNVIYYVVPFLVLLGILVFVHELGHYIIAKFCGVRVEEFSIGFGKELWGFNDKSGTHWKISAIPLGGYCKFFGDADASSSTVSGETKELTAEEKKVAFPYQNPFKKLAIVLAGPFANYLFAILIFASIFFFLGKITFPPVVGEILPNSPAERFGIMEGDRIVKINGRKIENFSDINTEVALAVNGMVEIEIERGEALVTLKFPLDEVEHTRPDGTVEKRTMIGVKSLSKIEIEQESLSLTKSFWEATKQTWDLTTMTLRGVGQMITGQRSGEDVGGILRIAEMSGDISRGEGVIAFLVFMALISVNLGLINLFPIPVLDGGHVVIYMIEIVTGKEIGEKVKEWLFRIGLFLILALMIFATWNDVVRLFKRWFD